MLISVHIPKTAGTTFMQYLLKAFPNRVVGDYALDTELSDLFESCFEDITSIKKTAYFQLSVISEGVLKCQQAVSEKGIQVIHGHFGINKYLGVFPDATYAVWLREPLERSLSEYYHHKRLPESLYWSIYDRELTFDQWMRIEGQINFQYKLTNGDLSRFQFVGIVEEFDQSLSEFSRLAGIAETELNFHISPENINPEKIIIESYEIDDETRARFIELNQLDIALYRDAVDRFERNRDRYRQCSSKTPGEASALIEQPLKLEDQLVGSVNTFRALQNRLLAQDKQVETISAELAERAQETEIFSRQLEEKDTLIELHSTELAAKDLALQTVSAEFTEQIRALQSEVARAEEHVHALSAHLLNVEAQLKKITDTLGWRLLSRYGRVKHKYLLPVFRRLARSRAEP